jgi:hypothetical protein
VWKRVPCQFGKELASTVFESYTEGAGDAMILAGFFSGLEAQSEITDLLDMMYVS